MDATFPHSYELEYLSEMPSMALPRYYYPGASTQGGRDGMLILVRPEHAQAWLGIFAFGCLVPEGITGVFAMPDPELLCVVSSGDGYIVNTAMPTAWEEVRAMPIMDVRLVQDLGIIVFANFIELVAYCSTGIKWRTERLAWDNLKITEVADTSIVGEFPDIYSEEVRSFVVDLATGAHQGAFQFCRS